VVSPEKALQASLMFGSKPGAYPGAPTQILDYPKKTYMVSCNWFLNEADTRVQFNTDLFTVTNGFIYTIGSAKSRVN
jgi:hypothetical protein